MCATLRFQIGLLALLSALLLANNVIQVATNGLAGLRLAANTLPVTGYVLGGALWAMPAAALMRRFGRQAGYTAARWVRWAALAISM